MDPMIGGRLIPLQNHGISTMSMGYLVRKSASLYRIRPKDSRPDGLGWWGSSLAYGREPHRMERNHGHEGCSAGMLSTRIVCRKESAADL